MRCHSEGPLQQLCWVSGPAVHFCLLSPGPSSAETEPSPPSKLTPFNLTVYLLEIPMLHFLFTVKITNCINYLQKTSTNNSSQNLISHVSYAWLYLYGLTTCYHGLFVHHVLIPNWLRSKCSCKLKLVTWPNFILFIVKLKFWGKILIKYKNIFKNCDHIG